MRFAIFSVFLCAFMAMAAPSWAFGSHGHHKGAPGDPGFSSNSFIGNFISEFDPGNSIGNSDDPGNWDGNWNGNWDGNWDGNSDGNWAGDPGDPTAAIPEPMTLTLLALGLAWMISLKLKTID